LVGAHARVLFAAGLVALGACRVELGPPGGGAERGERGGEVWVYTSMYREVVADLQPLLRRALPDVDVQVFQAGSEKVRSRLEAELAAGATRCDLLLVSDPAAYASFAHRRLLLPRVPPAALRSPRALLDLDGRYALARVSTMVIGVNPNALGEAPRPRGFADLPSPALRGRVTMGDPLSSGTALTSVGALAERLGWPYLERLARNGLTASGGNAAVLSRLESREAAAGIVLYENIVLARRKGSPVEAVWPLEGAILVAGHVAILAGSRRRAAAARVEDFLLGPAAQRVIVASGMHGADPAAAPPDGASPLGALVEHALLPPEARGDPAASDAALRTRWSALVR
jgi:iron(III) transport system substrate-binding protein